MRTSDFDYDLPPELIAQTPIEPRDASRLLVVNRATGELAHRQFRDIGEYLHPGDLLVANRSRVIPARLAGRKAGSGGAGARGEAESAEAQPRQAPAAGGAVEALLLARRPDLGQDHWEALVRPGRRIREGQELRFERAGAGALTATVVARTEAGGRILRFLPPASGEPVDAVLARLGSMPLPPYIHAKLEDNERYQTVYSREPGSAAAPTAGLHFTTDLLERLRAQGVETAYVLLHVGLDTFRPVEEENPSDHKMHSEAFELDAQAAAQINAARARGGRIVAVGTTSVRVLESLPAAAQVEPSQGRTMLFITPGYQFRHVDALITNFHLPRSSLMMLVSAFAGMGKDAGSEGIGLMRRAYAEAIAQRYRFFSFGDAMLIL